MCRIKVSVIMPSLNVAGYIGQCLESVRNQTLKDMEILCVDAGSDDGTMDVLEKAAAEDARIRIIRSDKKSYGYQMNLGIDAAQGEYIGILETDDFAETQMFEELYREASAGELDVIKSSFFLYYSEPKEKNKRFRLPKQLVQKGVFAAAELPEPEKIELLNCKPSIWSAIYRRDFLLENRIRFLETAGAAFQDTSFNFKALLLARRLMLTEKAYVHYRQDNEQSSVNSPKTMYSVCDEYAEIKRFIDDAFAEPERTALQKIRSRIMFNTYMWNYQRLAEPLSREFLDRFAETFRTEPEVIEKAFYSREKWEDLCRLTEDPEGFHREQTRLRSKPAIIRALRKAVRRVVKGGAA